MSLYQDDIARERIYLFRPNLTDVSVPTLADGYTEVESVEEIIPKWAVLMNQVLGTSIENPPLITNDNFNHDLVILVQIDELCVGVCIGWYDRVLWPNTGQIFFTAVHPEHRGKKLGEYIVAKLLNQFSQEGFQNSVLSTENYRVPAICLYHKLGFIPLFTNEVDDEEKRWRMAVLNSKRPELMDNIWDDYSHLTEK